MSNVHKCGIKNNIECKYIIISNDHKIIIIFNNSDLEKEKSKLTMYYLSALNYRTPSLIVNCLVHLELPIKRTAVNKE